MIERTLRIKLLELTKKYPIVTLTGPRQSGKSTLLRHAFSDYKYVSLEDPDMRLFATDDPRGFLATYPDKTIIDEAQRVPALFSYIQTHTDKEGREGMYLLAGSHNFLLMENINQSLAGRTAILKLLPFSHAEMKESEILPRTVDDEIFNGGYPRLYDKDIAPSDYYPFYIQTYVERDVRLMKNIGDLSKFIRFIKLCAGRIGQLLKQTAAGHQVLCITHTPQVAAFADNQLLIRKEVRDGRTYTQIHTLDLDARVRALAAMISGDKVTELSLANAREMIEKSK